MTLPVLNRQLVLEVASQDADGAGGFVETWQVRGTLWASVTAGTGRARDASGIPVGAVPLKIVVRAAPQGAASRPKAGDRLREGDRVFLIQAVAERDATGRYLTCFADEEVAA